MIFFMVHDEVFGTCCENYHKSMIAPSRPGKHSKLVFKKVKKKKNTAKTPQHDLLPHLP